MGEFCWISIIFLIASNLAFRIKEVVGFVRILIGLSANIPVVQNGSELSGQIANSQPSTDDNWFVV